MTDETPVLKGYEVTWDGDGWVARSQNSTIVLRGTNQAELNEARHRAYSAELSGIRRALRTFDPSGYRKTDIPPDGSVSPP